MFSVDILKEPPKFFRNFTWNGFGASSATLKGSSIDISFSIPKVSGLSFKNKSNELKKQEFQRTKKKVY